MYEDPLEKGALLKMAVGLGADVPFFLNPKPYLARGIGEVLDPIKKWPKYQYVIVNPPIKVSTAWAYANLKLELTIDEYNFIVDYLSKTKDTDYDKLIKLCDYISLPSGFCLMEKRIVEMTLRGGVNKYTIPRWKATFEIKEYFEKKIGKSIYSVLPGVVENTFEL